MENYFDVKLDTMLYGTIEGNDMPPRSITWRMLSSLMEHDVVIDVLMQLVLTGKAEFKFSQHIMYVRLINN